MSMILVARDLSRAKIVGHEGSMKWYKINKDNNEVLMLINEKLISETTGERVNIVDFKSSFARISIDFPKFGQEFYEKNKQYTPRVFTRQAAGNNYNEYAVESWGADEEGLYIKFVSK